MTDSSFHQHDHSHSSDTTWGAFLIAISINLGFTIIEAIYAVAVNSASLLADAGHNLGDVTGLLLAWGASYLAGIKSTRNYSYGYKRSTILATIINALILVFTAALIVFESIRRMTDPVDMQEIPVMIVATIGIFVNALSALMFHKGSRQDLNVKAAYLHLVYDALISVGVVVTAALIYLTGWQILDSLMALAIGGIIIVGSWQILRESVNLILDAVPQHVDPSEVETWLRDLEGVSDLHDVHIWGMSTRETGMTAHLVMPENNLWSSENGFTEISDELKKRFRINHVTLQVEKGQDCNNEDCCD